MAKSYFYDESIADWRELVKGEQGERGPVGPVGPEGPQGEQGPMGSVELVGDPSITVDTSVGTRVFVGDTMIYGDTGWRDIASLLEFDAYGLTEDRPPIIYIKRENSTVWLSFDAFSLYEEFPGGSSQSLINLPNGFVPQRPVRLGSGSTYELHSALYTSGSRLINRDVVNPGSRRFYVSWSAVSYWPTELPGTPA